MITGKTTAHMCSSWVLRRLSLWCLYLTSITSCKCRILFVDQCLIGVYSMVHNDTPVSSFATLLHTTSLMHGAANAAALQFQFSQLLSD